MGRLVETTSKSLHSSLFGFSRLCDFKHRFLENKVAMFKKEGLVGSTLYVLPDFQVEKSSDSLAIRIEMPPKRKRDRITSIHFQVANLLFVLGEDYHMILY